MAKLQGWARTAKHYTLLSASLIRGAIYDNKRLIKYSHGSKTPISQVQSQFRIRKAYHGIEKGLSLPEPRYQFGTSKVANLVSMVNDHIRSYGLDSVALAASSSILYYDQRNDTNFGQRLHGIGQAGDVGLGGIDEIEAIKFDEPTDFLKSRRSIRQYGSEPVPKELILQAASIAQNAPSVCNRQACKIYAFEGSEILQNQPGNAGFGETAAWGLVVTSDLKAFSTSGERHQAWCDGGMFAMSLLYGLHAQHLGACPLAWTPTVKRDKSVRNKLGIPDNEVIIMFISVGSLKSSYKVAKSHRKDMKDTLIFVEAFKPTS